MLIAWCLFSSVGNVITGDVEQGVSPLSFCFYLFAFVNLIFLLLNINQLAILIKKIKAQWRYVLIINVTTFFCWYFLIYPLKYIEPSVITAIVLGTVPIATWISSVFIYKKQRIVETDIMFSIFFAISIIYLCVLCVVDKNTMQLQHHHAHMMIIVSLLLAILGGCILAVNTIYAKKLSDAGWRPLDVLAARFWLIMVLGGFGVLHHRSIALHHALMIGVAATGLLLIVGPQLVFQAAVKQLDPLTLSMLPPLMPVLTFFIEFFDHQLNPTMLVLLGVSAIGLCSIAASTFRFRQANLPNSLRAR